MVDANAEPDLGSWSDADFAATVSNAAGTGADAGIPNEVRFKRSVAKLVRRRRALAGTTSEETSTAVFLLFPSPPDGSHTNNAKRVPCLDSGLEELGERVWFVGAAPGSGHWIDGNFEDDDGLFKFVTDELELGKTPAIIFNPQHPIPHLRFYPTGLSNLEEFDEVPVDTLPVTIQSVTTAVDNTHKQLMITPDAQPTTLPLWTDAAKCRPFKEAELRTQGYLRVALNSAFPTCTIRFEPPSPKGRLDLAIVETDPIDGTKETQHAVLELKVLRSFGSTGKNVSKKKNADWIETGVKQAYAYRLEKGAKWSALICFDMRASNDTDEKCFQHVKVLANKLDVHLRRWFLYNSSAEYRSALAANET